MIITYGLRAYLAKHPDIKAVPVKAGMTYEVGSTYWCGYWEQSYQVLSVQHDVPIWQDTVTIRWEDGREVEHSTSLDSKWDAKLVRKEARE